MRESSSTDEPPKLEPMSTKVGNEPVVIPLIRCNVVVGGSENELKMKDREGYLLESSLGSVRTLWWKGELGIGGSGEMKSKRSASMMSSTSFLCVCRVLQETSLQVLMSGSAIRVSKNP